MGVIFSSPNWIMNVIDYGTLKCKYGFFIVIFLLMFFFFCECFFLSCVMSNVSLFLKLFIVCCTNVMASIRNGKQKVDNVLSFFFKSNWTPNKSFPLVISSKFWSVPSFEANSNKSKVELNLKSMHNNHVCNTHVCNLCAQMVWQHLFLMLHLTCLKSTFHQTKEISLLSKKPKKTYNISHNFCG